QLSELPNSYMIEIFEWTVTARTGPMLSAARCDALQASLGIPYPEMMFGNNLLQIKHHMSGWTYTFRSEDALSGVKSGPLKDGDRGVEVGYADAWLKSWTGADSQIPLLQMVATKPYDWTYSTSYAGTTRGWELHSGHPPTLQRALLDSHCQALTSGSDLNLFYTEIPLFNNELHDNSASHLLVCAVRLTLPNHASFQTRH
ncbi:TIP41-like family-domain-containing protein, partial [Lactarius pseudohatsudake]